MSDLPPAAVEAAANRVRVWMLHNDEYGSEHGFSAVDDSFWVDGVSLNEFMGEALTAAYPAIAEHLREQIAGEIDLQADQPGWSEECATGLRIAAELIRPLTKAGEHDAN